MLVSIRFCLNHSGRIRSARTMRFRPGINVLAGPNGSGKSTVLRVIDSCRQCEKTMQGDTFFHYFNAETMNPRTAAGPAGNLTQMALRVRSKFSSHGEILKAALTALRIRKGECLLVDEPEAGQDMESILRIKEGLEAVCAAGGQVIAASHHPALWKDVHVIELAPGYTRQVRKKCRGIVTDDDRDM